MLITALLLAAASVARPSPTLILEKVRAVDDPRGYDLRDDLNGDRGVPISCSLARAARVTLSRGQDAMLEVEREGTTKSVLIEDVRGLGRSTLACGEADDFYYANPRHGQIYAYSADRLFEGANPLLWTRRVEPFRAIDEVNGVMTDASVATVLLIRQKLLLAEWFYRHDGATEFWHEVLDPLTGGLLGKLGPSDLLAKTNERDPWWILFEGGGNETINYVPRSLYRLRYGALSDGEVSARRTLELLRAQPPARRLGAITSLSVNPVVNHMIALLTPTRTTSSQGIDFCPVVPADRAQYWLGADYDPDIGELARNILMRFWAENASLTEHGNPLNAWFQTTIARSEPMKTLLVHFDPQDDQWIAAYQTALLDLGGPTFDRLDAEFGAGAAAVHLDSGDGTLK